MSTKKKFIFFIVILVILSIVSSVFSKNSSESKIDNDDFIEKLNRKMVPEISKNEFWYNGDREFFLNIEKNLLGVKKIKVLTNFKLEYEEVIKDEIQTITIKNSNLQKLPENEEKYINIRKEIEKLKITQESLLNPISIGVGKDEKSIVIRSLQWDGK